MMLGTDRFALTISGLPDHHCLAQFARRGVRVVNVSGLHLRAFSDLEDGLAPELIEFSLVDVFSPATCIQSLDDAAPQFESILPLAGRRAFAGAVAATAACLEQQRPVHVCCHRGLGRSPTVAWAALVMTRLADLDEGLRWIRRIRPETIVTQASLSAVRWVERQIGTREFNRSDG